MAACYVDGCGRSVYARQMCVGHYSRKRDHGDVLAHVPIGSMQGGIEHARDCARCGGRLSRWEPKPSRCESCIGELTVMIDTYAKAAALYVLATMAAETAA